MRLIVGAVAAVVLAMGLVACGGGGKNSAAQTNVDVTLSEWAITANPATVGPGGVTFHFNNTGQFAHDFVVVKSDLPPGELPMSNGAVDKSKLNVHASAGPIAPGRAPEGDEGYTVNLTPGKYVLLCDIVVRGIDSVESHYRNGMYTSFLVEP